MNWSKVKSGHKPTGWWYHKILCEFGWNMRNILGTISWYYYHLGKMVSKYGINIYGEKI